MTVIKEGVKVNISFEVKLETGEIVLKTEESQPIEIVVGAGNIPKTVENILIDMKEGKTKTIPLKPDEAFGPKINDLIVDLPKEEFDTQVELAVGSRVSIDSPEGKKFIGSILEVKDKEISVDFNHPLAGKNIVFTITLISIV